MLQCLFWVFPFTWRMTSACFGREKTAITLPPVPFRLWSLGTRFRFTFKEVTFQFAYSQTFFNYDLFFLTFNFSLASSVLNGSHVYSLFRSQVGLDPFPLVSVFFCVAFHNVQCISTFKG